MQARRYDSLQEDGMDSLRAAAKGNTAWAGEFWEGPVGLRLSLVEVTFSGALVFFLFCISSLLQNTLILVFN